MSEWRYFAQRFDGTGNLGDFVDLNLPLHNVEIEEVLSGHNSLSATIAPEMSSLKGADGRPVFDEYGVCIWAESPSGDVFGGILESSSMVGPEWSIECTDLSGVFINQIFDGATYFVDVDPIDLFRWLWVWYQSRPGCNFGVTADTTKSPVLLGSQYVQVEDFDQEGGEPEAALQPPLGPSSYPSNIAWVDKAVKKLNKREGWAKDRIRTILNLWLDGTKVKNMNDFQKKVVHTAVQICGKPPNDPEEVSPTPTIVVNPVTYQKDPYKLNWYTDQDLSKNIDDLAAQTPFDWHLQHHWSDEGIDADLQHHIRIGYPRLGRRLDEMRFVIGENIDVIPQIDRNGEEYANEVIVLGNGEGAAMINGRALRAHPGRMRRTIVITDQSIMDAATANRVAEQELAKRNTLEDVQEIMLMDHPNAPAGAVRVGDEILLQGDTGWISLNVWVRVVGRRFSPDEDSAVALSVIRSDRLP